MKKSNRTISEESDFVKNHRNHQDWWRQNVLNEEKGKHWNKNTNEYVLVGNRISNGEKLGQNFLSDEIRAEVKSALANKKKGIIEKKRLYNNLLSSQPLAFNFFGFFNANKEVAMAFLQTIKPDIIAIEAIVFEFAPKSSGDNSAFDFGFKVSTEHTNGFIGFECKYTDTFSYQRSVKDSKEIVYYGQDGDNHYERYHEIFAANRDRLPDEYDSYVKDKKFNQLFRNELLGIHLKSESNYDFIITGLFCHHQDPSAVTSGKLFQQKVGNGKNDFIVMTYADYFERMLRLNLHWALRELVMKLWVRYCALELSHKMRSQL